MAVVGSAAVQVFPSFRGFKGAVDSEVKGTGKRGGGLFSSAFAGAIGGGIALVGSQIASGLGSAIGEGIKGAADLEQSIGAVQSIFKESAGQILGWSDTAATSVGLTKNEFNELGSLIGAQLKNGGTAMDELAPKTNDLITLGADLSSMFGGTTADAVGALSSALKGERDPIERYGVSLNQAKIDAEAAALGFEKVGGSLSAEAQQAATLSLIMKQTTDAHGNFAKEADTISGKQQRLNALWNDGKTAIAGAFLPALSSIAEVAVSALPPVLKVAEDMSKALGPALSTAAQQIGPAMEQAVGAIAPLAEQIGEHVTSVSQQITAAFADFDFRQLLTDLQPFGAAVISVFGSLSQAVKAVLPIVLEIGRGLADTFQENLPEITSAVQSIGAAISGLGEIITTVWTAIGPVVVPIVQSVFGLIVDVVSGAADILAGVVGTVSALLKGDWAGAWASAGQIVDGVVKIITGVFDNIMRQSAAFAAFIISKFTGTQVSAEEVMAKLPKGLQLIWDNIRNTAANAMKTLYDNTIGRLTAMAAAVGTQIYRVRTAIADGINTARATAVNTVTAMVSAVVGRIASLVSAVSSRISAVRQSVQIAFTGARDAAAGALTALVTTVTSRISQIVTTIAGLPGRARSALAGMAGALVSAGGDLVRGFISGMTGAIGRVAETARNMASQAIEAAKGALKIASPSRVFAEIGEQTGAGLINGMDGMQRAVGVSGGALAAAAVPGVPGVAVRTMSAADTGIPSGPAVFHLYDSDGQLLGTMQGVAQATITEERRRHLEAV